MNRLLAMLLALTLSLTLGGGCSHIKKESDAQTLAPAVDAFHQRVRWKDYRIASRYIVPERRQDFDNALKAHGDEKDLEVNEYEVESVDMLDDGMRARVTSHWRWIHLPSPTVKDEQVTSEFVYRNGQWLLEKQTGGPFDGVLP